MKLNRFVYFDLGNVLVHFDHRLAAQNLAQACDLELDMVFHQLFTTDLQERYETGLISSTQYCREINSVFECDLPDQVILDAISDMFRPNWEILQSLNWVRESQIPMGILSNTCEAHWQWLMRQDWPMLHGYFQPIILSYQIGSMKPAPTIYSACEQACGQRGSQIFFTDDRADNIAAAARCDWTVHQFQHVDSLMDALRQWAQN